MGDAATAGGGDKRARDARAWARSFVGVLSAVTPSGARLTAHHFEAGHWVWLLLYAQEGDDGDEIHGTWQECGAVAGYVLSGVWPEWPEAAFRFALDEEEDDGVGEG